MTNTFVYYAYKFPKILKIIIENFLFPPLSLIFRFLVLEKIDRLPKLGYQQIIKINRTDSPALIQKIINQYINNPNLYSYHSPAKLPLISLIIIILTLVNFKSNSIIINKTNIPIYEQLVLNLVPQNICLTSAAYDLGLTKPSSLLVTLEFCSQLTKTIVINIPDQYILESINWNNKQVGSNNFVLNNRQLIYNLISTENSENVLSLKLNRKELPNKFTLLAILPENLLLKSHTLLLKYPPGINISFDQKPAIAEEGLVRYNLPLSGNFYLTIQHD